MPRSIWNRWGSGRMIVFFGFGWYADFLGVFACPPWYPHAKVATQQLVQLAYLGPCVYQSPWMDGYSSTLDSMWFFKRTVGLKESTASCLHSMMQYCAGYSLSSDHIKPRPGKTIFSKTNDPQIIPLDAKPVREHSCSLLYTQ